MGLARERVERAGVAVPALIDRLVSAARAELIAVYRCTILIAEPPGPGGEGLREILADIRAEDRRHFDALVGRVYELDGRLPDDLGRFLGESAGSPPEPGPDASDPGTAFAGYARRAVAPYTELCELTAGRDHRTHRLAEAIRVEKLEHQAWLAEFFGTGPPGRFRRGFRGRSPFVAGLPGPNAGPD
ncbi:DNA protection protein DPS [Nonomuraea sp. NN258]|uniref:ferritin-like domain-containing protein n=1 Tax=Nonomuraea antri TaxID=2730852 RepID=UPI00156A672F|nr:ferritin-like domain-containing protein [Nonomuraea antri]NRQ40439.1 DNA protection protein DPS [Nonomuraea antri]